MSFPANLKIVEIANFPLLQHAFPGQVSFFSTWSDGFDKVDDESASTRLHSLAALWRAVHDPATSIVVCRPTFYSPWHWRWLVRVFFDRRSLSRLRYFKRGLGPQLLRWRIPAPLVVWDTEDQPVIKPNNLFLLDRCRLYFKRELPPDHWRLFKETGHSNLPSWRYRSSARNHTRIAKLRPISLGVPMSTLTLFPQASAAKSADIFFAGSVEGTSSLRQAGLLELLALRDHGYVIDISEKPLDPAEFYRRCARARLVWSPEGYGWDCFRHYEVAMCGSVPLINSPTIERYQPFVRGEHAVYYDVEPGELMRAAEAALADKPRLEWMGHAARTHCLTHHTADAICQYVVRSALEAAAGTPKAASEFRQTPAGRVAPGQTTDGIDVESAVLEHRRTAVD